MLCGPLGQIRDRRIVAPPKRHLLGRLTDEIQHNSNDSLVGLYVYGSLVTGDFDKDRSDIDLLAVVDSDVDGDTYNEAGDEAGLQETVRFVHDVASRIIGTVEGTSDASG
jgi:predicted nucleotidyltransferase